MSLLRSFSSDTPDSGFLLTTVLSAQNNYPIDGASVSIADESDPDTNFGGAFNKFCRSNT